MPAAAKQKVILTLEELLERLAYWQTHLGLTEWEFVLKVGRFSGLRDCQADVNWNLSKRQALIKILDAADYGVYVRCGHARDEEEEGLYARDAGEPEEPDTRDVVGRLDC